MPRSGGGRRGKLAGKPDNAEFENRLERPMPVLFPMLTVRQQVSRWRIRVVRGGEYWAGVLACTHKPIV